MKRYWSGSRLLAKSSPLSDKDLFNIYRDYLKHEDMLIQHRIGWLLILTGMMLTTYIALVSFLLISAWSDRLEINQLDFLILKQKMGLLIPVFLISLSGVGSSIVCLASLNGAVTSISSILAQWQEIIKTRPIDKEIPQLTYGFGHPKRVIAGYPRTVCLVVCALWCTSLFADAYLLGYYRAVTQPATTVG